MWSDKLKLNKQLLRSVTEAGYLTPKEVQVKTMSRMIGGQDIITIGPEGCGKTTAYIIGVLMRLKYGVEGHPVR
jgi:ATP-dependent RNA helicase RhlE